MEERDNEHLVEIIYKRALQYHCKEGLNKNCDCSFCLTKREVTYDLHVAGRCPRTLYKKSYSERLKELRDAPFIGD